MDGRDKYCKMLIEKLEVCSLIMKGSDYLIDLGRDGDVNGHLHVNWIGVVQNAAP
jgi:hypothetical protein